MSIGNVLSPQPKQPSFRNFDDPVSTRKAIYDRTLAAAQSLPEQSYGKHSIKLTDVAYEGPENYSLAQQKSAILEGRTLGRRLRGTWSLTDNTTGQKKEERRATIATVPFMSQRGTFIQGGNEYALASQLRLRPGIFSREQENGELEAHVNVLPGQGRAHRYFLDPEKLVFYTRVQQAKIPLLPLLRAAGMTDRQLRAAWGNDILAANMPYDSPAALQKYYERFLPNRVLQDPQADRKQALVDTITSMQLDPEVTQRTLGKPYASLSMDTIIDTTKKLLAISRGEADTDDRDNLAYQTLLGPEDLISERISKDYGGFQRKLLRKAAMQGSLKPLTPGALDRQVQAAIMTSGLGNHLEEVNAAEVFDKQWRLSRMGEGGIPSTESIPDEARTVQPSHYSFVDPLRTPESLRAGVDVYLARSAVKGNDGKIYAMLRNVRNGRTIHRSPQDIADSVVAFPQEMQKQSKRVWAMHKGRMRLVPKSKVEYELPHFEDAFSPLSNLIPFKSASKGHRSAMGSRMLTQALPLIRREAPLVQSGVPGSENDSYENMYGKHMGALRADKPARVLDVSPSGIKLRYADGTEETQDLYNNYPYNMRTFLHQEPVVKPGDQVKPGQLLARSNYTDNDGVTSLGTNARVAFMSWEGKNHEDAIVISESFAEKLRSEHMYQHRLDNLDDHKLGRGSFIGLFPGRFDRKQLDKIDEHGIAKPGVELNYGDPVILAAKPTESGQHRVHRKGGGMFADASVTWDHSSPGMITDVSRTKSGISVLVKSTAKMQPADKLSSRWGSKGIVADIVPDEKMPQGADGKPFEVLVNPLSVVSRGNPSQIIETVLGKIAAKTGKPYRVADFENIKDLVEFAQQELAKNDLSDTEDVIDPTNDRKIPGVLTGQQYFLKLYHTAEDKSVGRSTGGYTDEGLPARGGPEGSKRISGMDLSALLSHGAIANLRDISQVRGQRNEDYWLAFLGGYDPPKPDVPFIYRKFVDSLKASGINVISDGTQSHIMAMTDRDIQGLAGDREISSGDTVDFIKNMSPISGGLFDPKLTGGNRGDRWAKISLAEPMLNPVMEEPARRLLGLTQKQFEDVLAGRLPIKQTGQSGPQAIAAALKSIDLDKEIASARQIISEGKRTPRDAAIRKLGYLKSAKQLGIHPGNWVINAAPVLPPIYRPVSVLSGSKIPVVDDANMLYKELIEANNNLRDMKREVDDVGEERLAVYNAFKSVVGLGDPLQPKLREKKVRGILKQVLGSSPKYGTMQRRLLSTTVDMVGRGVILPNPDMDMDTIGLPEEQAWDVYRNFVVRRLRRRGLPLMEAIRHATDHTDVARAELLKEMEDRPVLLNRAPVLHRFGIMAFRPRLVKASAVQMNPLVTRGFNLDYDGDAMQYHVPVSEDARREALDRMLPSKNLISTADLRSPMHKPGQEYVGGLYAATRKSRKPKPSHVFQSINAAIQAFRRGELSLDTPVEVNQ